MSFREGLVPPYLWEPLIQEDKIRKVELPKKYIINENATILYWQNGEKTIVKKCKEDEFNARLGFLTAFFQHYSGMSKTKANEYLSNLSVVKNKIVFNIGDKVEALRSTPWVSKGWVGIVQEKSTAPFVRWSNGGKWAIEQEKIKLIEKASE